MKTTGILLIIVSVIVVGASMLGLAGAFQETGRNGATPSELATGLQGPVWIAIAAFSTLLIGVLFFVWGLVRSRRTSRALER